MHLTDLSTWIPTHFRLIKEITDNYGVSLQPVTPRVKDWTFSSAAGKPGLSDLDEKKFLDAMLTFKYVVRSALPSHKAILDECDRCVTLTTCNSAFYTGLLNAGSLHMTNLLPTLLPGCSQSEVVSVPLL